MVALGADSAAGPGGEPRELFAETRQIRIVDVVLPLRKRCISRPEPHHSELLQRLGLSQSEMVPVTTK